MLETERAVVAAAARRLAATDLVLGTAGNVSARSGDLVAITPTGAALSELTGEQVSVVGLDGRHVDGALTASSEIDLHLGAYRRFELTAAVHTHAPISTALACVLDELPVVHYGMLALGGSIRVAPYATFGTPELAESTLDALDGRLAVLMANHGTLALGMSVEQAVENTLLLEWACEVYWRAAQLGAPRILGDEQCAAVVEAVVSRNYGKPTAAGAATRAGAGR